MCRISGFTIKDKNNAIRVINLMNKKLIQGGPDDEGIYIDENLCLGHRRLSIIDLSEKAHQPMFSEDKNYVIVYNGEVYNYRELKWELNKKGHKFVSDSDTEVVLKSFIEWGVDSFKKLNGMFTFSIYDKRNKKLLIVRDHLGIKPVYYSIFNDGIVFSSEIRGLKIFNPSWEEDEKWRIYFLIFGFIPEPFTTLKNVFILPYGSYLEYDMKTKNYFIKRYFEFKFYNDVKDEKFSIKKTRELLIESIKRHLITDAPLGVFLSGGVDSSLIAIIASRFKDDIKTLSISFDEKNYDESFYQNKVLENLNVKHFSFKVKKMDFQENLGDILEAMDQPTFDGINTYFISRFAKEIGLKTVLSGLGSDEFFGGYPSFKRIETLILLKSIMRDFSIFEYFSDDRIKRLSYLGLNNSISYYLSLRSVFTINEISQLLDIGKKEIIRCIKDLFWDMDKDDFGRKNFVSYLEIFYMRNQLLKDSDFMSMWNSVEIRVPFLDKEFLKFILSIDEKIKFKKEKHLLKEGFGDILPEVVIKRKKQGFSFPMKEWLKDFEITYSEICDLNRRFKEFLKRKNFADMHWTKKWTLLLLSLKKNF